MNRRTSLLLLFAASCSVSPPVLPPSGQIVLHVTTDAPLPFPPGQTADRAAPPALFDTLQIDVFPPPPKDDRPDVPCAGCSRRFPIDHQMAANDGASVGIVPRVGLSGSRVRVQLFRANALTNNEPIESAAITQIIALPTTSADGIIDVTVDLRTDTVGTPSGTLAQPIAAPLGLPKKDDGHVGSWKPAQRTGCGAGPTPDGMVCVPGGAFWMGNPSVTSVLQSVDANVPRLVVLSPFYIDLSEVIVSKYRDAHVAREIVNPLGDVVEDPADNLGLATQCTFSSIPLDADHDALPVNCLTWTAARAYCKAHDGDLPTEAQWEYVAGNLASSTYPWGEDEPTCADAVFARQLPTIPLNCNPSEDSSLRTSARPGGGARDRVRIGDQSVVDLAGNLREWVLDDFAPQTSPCWNQPLLVDPVCVTHEDAVTVRGGSWHDQSSFLRVATRHFGGKNGAINVSAGLQTWSYYLDEFATFGGRTVGFRCAHPVQR